MNLAQYLMTPVTPLYSAEWDQRPDAQPPCLREAIEKRMAGVVEKYRKVMEGKILSTSEVGAALTMLKPLTGLRRLEREGHIRLHHVGRVRGQKTNYWEWIS